MMRAETKYIHKVEELPEGEHYAAFVNETYSTGDREDGYSQTPMVQIIHLGGSQNALTWLREQDEADQRWGSQRKIFKIVRMKSLVIHRTVSLELE